MDTLSSDTANIAVIHLTLYQSVFVQMSIACFVFKVNVVTTASKFKTVHH